MYIDLITFGGKAIKMKFRNILILFGLGTFISTAVSVYQQLFFTDAKTGFFEHSLQKLGWVLTLFIAVIAFCVGLVASQSARYPVKPKKHPVYFVVFSAVLSVGILLEAFLNPFIVSLGVGVKIAVVLFSAASAVGIVLFGINKGPSSLKNGVFMMLPLAYFLLRLALTFTRYSRLPTIASHVYELAWLCAAVLFFLTMSMISCNMRIKSCLKTLLPLSLVFGLISCVAAFGQISLMFVKGETHNFTVWSATELILAVYAISYALFTYSKSNLRTRPKRHGNTKVMEAAEIPDTEFKNTKES